MAYTALIAGASGLTGGHALELLLADPEYSKVTSIVRKPTGRTHPKLNEVVVNFDDLNASHELFSVDHVYCCLGSTIKKAGSKEMFRRIDHDYPLAMAELSELHNVKSYSIITALGADPSSMIFYNRVKGEVEQSIRHLSIPSVNILRPSILYGDRDESRPGEAVGQVVFKAIGPLMAGPLKKYRGISGSQVARILVRVGKEAREGHHIYESDKLQDL